jgi:hypothetical protein
MRLVSQAELLSFDDVVNVLILTDCVLGACVFTGFGSLRVDLCSQTRMVGEQLGCIDTRDRVDGNVGCLVLEATMDKDASVNAPNSGAESLNSSELVPFR